MSGLDPREVETWRTWIGREEIREERLDPEALRRFAAATGSDLEVERVQPSLGHWAFFLPVAAASEIGPDGHPRRGGFLPPVTLPRRMFAASDIRFGPPLALGEPARMTSRIVDVRHKSGRTGDLVFVEILREITQSAGTCISEQQTVVYREEGGATPAPEPAAITPEPGETVWIPGPVDLFRFSAVTFNSHRIHYDLPYATGEEGYPGLVVHGPFTASRLHAHAQASRGARLSRFAFRAMSPMFCGQEIRLRLSGDEAQAIRCDGALAMSASIAV